MISPWLLCAVIDWDNDREESNFLGQFCPRRKAQKRGSLFVKPQRNSRKGPVLQTTTSWLKATSSLKPKELVEKGLVPRLPKFTITTSKRVVIDWVHFNNRLQAMVGFGGNKVVRSQKTNCSETLRGLLFKQECYKQAEKYFQNNYGHSDSWKQREPLR